MIKDFLEKREKGELEIQKASKLRENVLGKVRKLLLGPTFTFNSTVPNAADVSK